MGVHISVIMMNEHEIKRAKRDLTEQYKKDMEALDRFLAIAPRIRSSRKQEQYDTGKTKAETLIDLVRSIGGQYKQKDAITFVKENDPIIGQDLKDQAIYKAIKALRDEGATKVVRPKKGKVGAVYENVSQQVSEAGASEKLI
jgi:hypothetical protein